MITDGLELFTHITRLKEMIEKLEITPDGSVMHPDGSTFYPAWLCNIL
jgi:hypothetical protein